MNDDAKLNEKQKEAIVAITVPQDVPLPPVLIIGTIYFLFTYFFKICGVFRLKLIT